MQKVFWTPRARGLLHCTGAKEDLGGAKDSGETYAPWAQKSQKDLLHPPLTTLETFLFGQFPRSTASLRVVKTVVLGNGSFVPYRKQGISTKTAKMTSLHFTHKNKGFAPQNPENDEIDENDRCHSSKTMVNRKQGFLGNGRNTFSRVLFRRRELTEFWGKLGEFCEKLGEFALAHK